MDYRHTSTGSGKSTNVPGDDKPYRSRDVQKELEHWMKKIRRHYQKLQNQSTSGGSKQFKRAVRDIWSDMKDLAWRCNPDAVFHDNFIRFSNKTELSQFLDDDLECESGERHVMIVNAAKPFTIYYDAVKIATVKHYYKYIYDSDSTEESDGSWGCSVS